MISILLKEDEFKPIATKEIRELKETSYQKDVLFNLESSKIKESVEIRVNYAEEGDHLFNKKSVNMVGKETEEIEAKKEKQLRNHKVIKEMRETPSIQEKLYSLQENFHKNIIDEDDLYFDQGESMITLQNNYVVANKLKKNIMEWLHCWKQNFYPQVKAMARVLQGGKH